MLYKKANFFTTLFTLALVATMAVIAQLFSLHAASAALYAHKTPAPRGITVRLFSPNVVQLKNMQITAIDVISKNDVLIAGTYCVDPNYFAACPQDALSRPYYEHFDGSHWSVIAQPDLDGSHWKVIVQPDPGNGMHINSMYAVSPHNIYAVGSAPFGGLPAKVLIEHYDGHTWSQMATPSLGDPGMNAASLNSVLGFNSHDIYAVGSTHTIGSAGLTNSLIEHFDGKHWMQVVDPTGAAALQSLQLGGSPDTMIAIATYIGEVRSDLYSRNDAPIIISHR